MANDSPVKEIEIKVSDIAIKEIREATVTGRAGLQLAGLLIEVVHACSFTEYAYWWVC